MSTIYFTFYTYLISKTIFMVSDLETFFYKKNAENPGFLSRG